MAMPNPFFLMSMVELDKLVTTSRKVGCESIPCGIVQELNYDNVMP
jgi:hypothetical protein